MSETKADRQGSVTQRTEEFYAALPFNFHETEEKAAQLIRSQNQIESYPNLHALLGEANRSCRVLDVGCGAGWFIHSVACYYGLNGVGIDLSEGALQRAGKVSDLLGISALTKFLRLDLFDVPSLPDRFTLVNTLGVLHHTFDCRQALRRVASWVQEGGYLHLGLYHRHGRKPFLDLFRGYRERMERAVSEKERVRVETEAFTLYRQLNSEVPDERFLFSWFRDQVLHPHESHHTVEEVHGWLDEMGFQCLTTSVNRFQSVEDWKFIFQEEEKMYDISYQRNHIQRVYFPGFFTLLARRR